MPGTQVEYLKLSSLLLSFHTTFLSFYKVRANKIRLKFTSYLWYTFIKQWAELHSEGCSHNENPAQTVCDGPESVVAWDKSCQKNLCKNLIFTRHVSEILQHTVYDQ